MGTALDRGERGQLGAEGEGGGGGGGCRMVVGGAKRVSGVRRLFRSHEPLISVTFALVKPPLFFVAVIETSLKIHKDKYQSWRQN